MDLEAKLAESERFNDELQGLADASFDACSAMKAERDAAWALLREAELCSDEHGAYIGVLCRPADWVERRDALLPKPQPSGCTRVETNEQP